MTLLALFSLAALAGGPEANVKRTLDDSVQGAATRDVARVASALDPAGETSAGEMTAAWTWEERRLVLEIAAPTTGWVAVGLNDRADLANSRLVMAAVTAEGAVAEEHVPRPPRHPHVEDLQVLSAEEADGWTRVRVALPRVSARRDAPVIRPGQRVWFTLAWSHSDDFGHHSAMRTASWVELQPSDPEMIDGR